MPNVVINVTSAVGQAIAGLQQVGGQVNNLTRGFSGLNSGLGRLGITLSGIFSARALVRFVNDAIAGADAMGKMASQVGTTVEQLSRLDYSARLAGLKLNEVREAGGAFSDWLKRTGSGSRDLVEALLEQADVFAAMPDSLTKTTLARERFGGAGAKLIPLLNQGSEALRKQFEESDRLGNTIGGTTHEAAVRFNDAMEKLRTTLNGVAITIAEALLPSLTNLTEGLVKSRNESEGFAEAVQFVGNWVRGLIVAVDLLWTALSSNATLIASVVTVAFANLAESTRALIHLAALWFDSLKAVGQALLNIASQASKAGEIMQAVMDRQFIHAALLAREVINGTGADLDKLGARLEANTAAAFATIAKTAAVTWSNVTGMGEHAVDEIAAKWSNFWERSMGVFSTTTRPSPGAPVVGEKTGTGQLDLLKQEPEIEGFFNRLSSRMEEMAAQWADLGARIADVMAGTVRRSIDVVADGMWDVIDGTRSWGEIFIQQSRQVISEIIKIGLQWVVSRLTMKATEVAASSAEAAAKAPSALLTSISSYGIAAGVGAAAFLAAIALTGGFKEGGFTGNGPTDQVAGAVHKGEFVVSNRGLRNVGQDFLEAINAGLIGVGDLANSIPVGIASSLPSAAVASRGSQASQAPTINIAILRDDAELRTFLESSQGEAIIINAVTGNRTEIGIPT